jgi:hypothetical protein
MMMAMRVVGNEEGNGDGNKVVGQGTVLMKRAKALATRVAGNKEGNGGKEGNGNINRDGRQ